MRTRLVALLLGAVISGSASAATDLVPTVLTVKMADSTSSPEEDSVDVTLTFEVRTGATKSQDAWIIAQLIIDGALIMNGGVDSNQTLASNNAYTYKIGEWVPKKAFSIAAFFDPYSISGETPSQAANNLLIKKFNFHPGVRKDTVYTGKNCVPDGGRP